MKKIKVSCSGCSRLFKVDERDVGKIAKCPFCGTRIKISEPTEEKVNPQQPPHQEGHSNSYYGNSEIIGLLKIVKKSDVITILLGLSFACLVLGVFKPVEKWEYRITPLENEHFTSNVNKIGNEGWQLVSARWASSSANTEWGYEMIFKRVKKNIAGQLIGGGFLITLGVLLVNHKSSKLRLYVDGKEKIVSFANINMVSVIALALIVWGIFVIGIALKPYFMRL